MRARTCTQRVKARTHRGSRDGVKGSRTEGQGISRRGSRDRGSRDRAQRVKGSRTPACTHAHTEVEGQRAKGSRTTARRGSRDLAYPHAHTHRTRARARRVKGWTVVGSRGGRRTRTQGPGVDGGQGDARARRVKGWTVVEMSVEHRPTEEGERRRIRASGGDVRRIPGGRVDGAAGHDCQWGACLFDRDYPALLVSRLPLPIRTDGQI